MRYVVVVYYCAGLVTSLLVKLYKSILRLAQADQLKQEPANQINDTYNTNQLESGKGKYRSLKAGSLEKDRSRPVLKMPPKRATKSLKKSNRITEENGSSLSWLSYGKYFFAIFVLSILVGYLLGEGLIQIDVHKRYSLNIEGRSCQYVWEKLRRFQ